MANGTEELNFNINRHMASGFHIGQIQTLILKVSRPRSFELHLWSLYRHTSEDVRAFHTQEGSKSRHVGIISHKRDEELKFRKRKKHFVSSVLGAVKWQKHICLPILIEGAAK